ncbi:M3 family peptidase, partial [bacterium]|nr:M3 family peptidase [bacterium]
MSTNDAPSASTNPLLQPPGLPSFDHIRPEHVVPAVRTLLAELAAELEQAEAGAAPDWPHAVDPIERIGDRLSRAWGTVGHLMGVKNSPELRKAHDEVQGEVVAFSMRMGQSKPLYQAFKALRDGPAFTSLDFAQQRIVRSLVRDAELAGVGLEGEPKERFNRIQAEMAEVSTRFSNNVLDATKAWSILLRSEDEVAGLPPSLRELAAQSAREAGEAGATA